MPNIIGRNHLLRLAGLLLLILLRCAAARGEAEAGLCFQQTGRVTGQSAVSLYAGADKKSEVISWMNPGESGVILAERNGYYQIRHGDVSGYVEKKKVQMLSVKTDQPLRETLCESVSLVEPAPSRQDTHLRLQGMLTSDQPLESLFFFIWDEREFRVEYTYLLTMKEPINRVEMSQYPRILPLKEMQGGRKTLVVEGVSGGELSVLFRSPAYVRGKSRELPHVTAQCEGLPKSVLDADVKTAWTVTDRSPSLEFTIPAAAKAVVMTLEWLVVPESCAVEMLDEAGSPLMRTELRTRFYLDTLDLPDEARQVVITPQGEKASLASVRLYAEPYSRHVLQRWEPVPEKIDLLVISTHQDDEFLFLGGTIPCYAAREDVSMAVLYMVNCGRLRYGEALDALWSAGLRNHPVFLNLPDSYTREIKEARTLWNRHQPLEKLISVIRQYRPEVIVVQDFRGEYGNGEHKLTAALTAEAVEKAAMETEDPESAALYGPWQVKKLYVHLYQENQIQMDWNQPLDETGVITPMFLAKEGFDRHRSQTALYSMESDGKRYDNSLFGLYYSAVGPDVEKNDFLENIR